MVVDSSVLVAALVREPGYEILIEKAGKADRVFVGAPTALETAIVLSNKFKQDTRLMIAGLLRNMPFTNRLL